VGVIKGGSRLVIVTRRWGYTSDSIFVIDP